MAFMLEELKDQDLQHLKTFDLGTTRGWLQLGGLLGFSTLFVFGFLGFLAGAKGVLLSGLSDVDGVLNVIFGLLAMFPAWLMVNAIRGRHLTKGKLVVLMLLFLPIGVYFAVLRWFDGRLFKKHLKSRADSRFIYVNRA